VIELRTSVVLVDIEGTLGPVAYVQDVLFPYAARRLSAYLEAHRDEPETASLLKEASELSGEDPFRALEQWQRHDIKAKPLKTLQGRIWAEGYAEGAFKSPLFPDALAALRRWREVGLPIHVYSSGSREAQVLYFRHSEAGDILGLFDGFFDTSIGAKTASDSYLAISASTETSPRGILFLSDNPAELAAATEAGLQVVHVVKDAQEPDARFRTARDFGELELTPVRKS
jgi:enolase-phosphatase E1